MWRDEEIRRWLNDLTTCVTDMCCFDLHLPSTEHHAKRLIKKSTRLLMTHEDMRPYLLKRCPGDAHLDHQAHATVAGSHPGIGQVSTHAGKYTPMFVQAMLDSVPALRSHEVLCLDGPCHDTSCIHEILAAEQEPVSDETLLKM